MNSIVDFYIQKYTYLLPLLLFLWAKKYGFDWLQSFFIGGIASFAYILYFVKNKKRIDYMYLAFYCFLITGMFLILRIPGLNFLYQNLKQSIIFIWLFIVGSYATFFTKYGFIDVKSNNKNTIKQTSLVLLGVVAIIFACAYLIKDSHPMIASAGGIVLFVIIRNLIRDRIK